jgi:hypothetical protein
MKSNIDYCGEKADIYIKIRLDDECKNGHQDFSITADIYKAGRRSNSSYLAGGCCHDDILKYFPEFKMFVNLHLSDVKGVPMYAVENGFYHLRSGFNNTKPTDKGFSKEFADYYRMTASQFKTINESENKLEYAILLKELGILEQWQGEANKAIETLEKLTGNEFVDDSVKSQYHEPKAEDIQNYTKQKEQGCYSLENKRKRAHLERLNKKAAKIQDIKNDCAKDVQKIEEDRNVKLWLISHIERINKKGLNRKKGFNLDFNFDNFIYYDHKKELKFNWLDYKNKMSEKCFELFCDNLNESDFNKLPIGISFNWGDKKQFSNR